MSSPIPGCHPRPSYWGPSPIMSFGRTIGIKVFSTGRRCLVGFSCGCHSTARTVWPGRSSEPENGTESFRTLSVERFARPEVISGYGLTLRTGIRPACCHIVVRMVSRPCLSRNIIALASRFGFSVDESCSTIRGLLRELLRTTGRNTFTPEVASYFDFVAACFV